MLLQEASPLHLPARFSPDLSGVSLSGTSLCLPLDCELRSLLASQYLAPKEQGLWGSSDFRTPGGGYSPNLSVMAEVRGTFCRAGVAGTYPAPAHHGSEPVLHHIEVARVRGTLEIWRERGNAVSEAVPFKAKEERMLPEITYSVPAQAHLRGTQQLLDEVASLLGDSCVGQRETEVLLLRRGGEEGLLPGRLRGEVTGSAGGAYPVVHDLAVGLGRGVGVEGRLPVEHFIGEHAQRPPVTLGPVAASPRPSAHRLQDLGRQVVRGAHSHQRPYLSQQDHN